MVETTSITVRVPFEVRDRHALAALQHGCTLAKWIGDVLARVDIAELPAVPAEDELEQLRRSQLAALEAAGVADPSVRLLLTPSQMPRVLQTALSQARRGGRGYRHFGAALGSQLRHLLPSLSIELDSIADESCSSSGPSRLSIGRLADLLHEHLPIALSEIDRHHHDAVLAEAIECLPRRSNEDHEAAQ